MAAGAALAGAPPAATRAMVTPGVTLSPSPNSHSLMVPSAGALTSRATLSVSISTMVSFLETASPTCLSGAPIVPSATLSPISGTVTSTLAPLGAGAAGAGAAALGAGAAPEPAPSLASIAPISTVSPSAATISESVPSSGAETSTETLSVSSSTSTSSRWTASPADLSHLPTVASVTDSPSTGTVISVMILFPICLFPA